jgi:phosphoglucosamine mutase
VSLFGTDGIRGVAGKPPLDSETIRRIGAALVQVLGLKNEPPCFLIGRDTRQSGVWIERELAYGAQSQGAKVTSAGIVPTPAIAYLTPQMGYTAGIVISASHNSFEDNGIKVFSGEGEKFTKILEQRVEDIVEKTNLNVFVGEPTSVEVIEVRSKYLEHLHGLLDKDIHMDGMRVVIDCANGATTTIAPEVFKKLGLDVTYIGCQPDGCNINLRCGSTATELLAHTVVEGHYQLGIAYDGDGDRAIFVDSQGQIVNGDAVMLICAKLMKKEDRLKDNMVVATVMSNIGLELALNEEGIELIRCPVGDKYVMEEMMRRNLSLGGEQSGHVIFSDYLFTGDGLATSLNILRAIITTGRELVDLASDLNLRPQVLLNIPVERKVQLHEVSEVSAVITDVERKLGSNGRLLIRYSGTEPLLRIMLEGSDQQEIQKWGEEIAAVAQRYL